MTWRTHLAGGLASLWVLMPLPHVLTAHTFGLAAICAGWGALLPDLDSRQSRLREVSIYGIYPFVIPSQMVRATSPHRGILHSLRGVAFVATCIGVPLAGLFGWIAGIGFLLGYATHLVLDCSTPHGLRLLWPNRDRSFLLPKGLRITTGSDLEQVVFVPLLCAILLLATFLLRS
jgi:membrane-bound metal-dependent hydrolase YbcI (DUF457 family)